MRQLKDFTIKPFVKGVLKDIPPQFMPLGGLTEGKGIRINNIAIERRLGYRRINDCEEDEYILGITQFRDISNIDYIFFGTKEYLYKIGYPSIRYWDDGYQWWDTEGAIWDAIEAGAVYQLTPTGEIQVCPPPESESSSSSSCSSSSSSESSSSSSESASSSSTSSSSSESCVAEADPFTGRDFRTALGDTSQWVFAPWGNNMIATNHEDPIVIIEGEAFDRYRNLECNGLQARDVAIFQAHVMALNTIDHIDGTVPNRMWWSGLDNADDWNYDDPTSEAGYITLPETPLPITGCAKIRDSFVVFQPYMMHLFNYVGGTLVFSRQVISDTIGALIHGLVVSKGDTIFFFGKDDIYKFDGYSIVSIGEHNNDWIFAGLNQQQVSRSFSFIDLNTHEAWFVIPYESDIPNLACIYDYINNSWTFEDVTATAGCPKVSFDYPFIAKVGVTISKSSSSSESSSSSSKSSSSSSISSSSSTSESSSSSSGG